MLLTSYRLGLPLTLALLAPACAGDDTSTSATSAGTGSTATTAATAASSDATTGTSAETSAGTSTATTDATTTGSTTGTSAATTGTSTSGTTGAEICHFGGTGESGGSQSPWLEVYHGGMPLQDGLVFGLSCGFQGFYMFELDPYFGGFDLDDEFVSFAVTMDVEGYNLNPDGHFYSIADLTLYIGCDIFDGQSYFLPILPPDGIPDLLVLDGLPATVSVALHPDGGGDDVVVAAAVTLKVAPDDSWQICGYMP